MRIAVIGLGLIGGSFALAAKERLHAQVSGWDVDPEAVRKARAMKAIDVAAPTLSVAVADADLALIAAPLRVLPGLVNAVLASAPAQCVVTDVGSAKRIMSPYGEDQRFIGGHPLAGAESAGIDGARADLFEGSTWYLTPSDLTSGVLYEHLHRILSGIGALPEAIDPVAHDRMLALISHLPHVLANVLVSQAAAGDRGNSERLPATGPSFRDATRVAGSNSSIWTDIYITNADSIQLAITETIARLQDVREVIAAKDPVELTAWNDTAAADRRRLADRQVAEGALYELRVTVPNRPGVVADLALTLGQAGVNIADMALYPAADLSDGVVAFWIVGDEDVKIAQNALAGHGVSVDRI